MSTRIGIGFSQHLDAEKCAKEAAFQAKTQLHHDRIDFSLVIMTVHYDAKKALPVIMRVLQDAKLIGCTSAGIILSDSIEHRGIAILACSSEEIKFGIGCVQNVNMEDGHKSGSLLARSTLSNFGSHSRQAFLFLADGNLKNTSEILKGAQEVLGNVFPVVGGCSSDDFHFEKTYQFLENNVLQNAAVSLLLGGHMSIGVGSRHGWRPLGKPRTIDKIDTNMIVSISGKKASSIYEEYFGAEAENLRSSHLGQMAILYPLGIYVDGSDEYLLKNAVDILADGSIVCQGEVPLGSEVHIMIGNKESCKQAAADAAREAYKNLLGKQAKLIIVLESMSRLKLLGRMAAEEINYIKQIFGPDIPLIGMYTNGEICPFQAVERFKMPHFQNESIVILAIS